MNKLNKKDFIYYMDNLEPNEGILHINITGIKNIELAKELYNLGASHSFNDCLDYMDNTYKLLYHSNDNPNFNKIINYIKNLKGIRANAKAFGFSLYNIDENNTNIEKRKKEAILQKELKAIFKPNRTKKQTVGNGIYSNDYIYYIDDKNKIYGMSTYNGQNLNDLKLYRIDKKEF